MYFFTRHSRFEVKDMCNFGTSIALKHGWQQNLSNSFFPELHNWHAPVLHQLVMTIGCLLISRKVFMHPLLAGFIGKEESASGGEGAE